MSELKTEAELKAALIDRLFAKREVCSDAVLISEMVVDSWARRADVVLANGKLSAFEIKSDFDTLTRLPGQLESYRNNFERVVVVVSPRFADKVAAMAPDGVGIWVMDGADHNSFREKRRARTVELSSSGAIGLMTVTDLRRLLAANGISGAARESRRVLEELAHKLTRKDLAAAARDSVKRRFRSHFVRFSARRKNYGTRAALRALKRAQRSIRTQIEDLPIERLPAVDIPQDHPLLVNTPAGPILKRARYPSSSSMSS